MEEVNKVNTFLDAFEVRLDVPFNGLSRPKSDNRVLRYGSKDLSLRSIFNMLCIIQARRLSL